MLRDAERKAQRMADDEAKLHDQLRDIEAAAEQAFAEGRAERAERASSFSRQQQQQHMAAAAAASSDLAAFRKELGRAKERESSVVDEVQQKNNIVYAIASTLQRPRNFPEWGPSRAFQVVNRARVPVVKASEAVHPSGIAFDVVVNNDVGGLYLVCLSVCLSCSLFVTLSVWSCLGIVLSTKHA